MAVVIRTVRRLKLWIFDFVYFITPTIIIKRQINKSKDQWRFIIGCNNSGTTLLKTIIESHPNVIGIEGEGQYRTKEFITDREIGLNRLFSERLDVFREVKYADPLKVKYDWLVSLIRRKKRAHKYILEKTTVNAVRVPWLLKNFPNAKFIVIFREAYAVVEGMRRKENIEIERGVNHWLKTNSMIIEDFEGHTNVIFLRYEDLTEQPVRTIRTIWHFLDLKTLGENEDRKEYTVHGQKKGVTNQNSTSKENLSKEDFEEISNRTQILRSRINEYTATN